MTLSVARGMVERCRAKAEAMGVRVAVAVVDASGNLVTLDRMDGTRLLREEYARAKAFTAVYFARPTKEVAALQQNNPTLFQNALSFLQGRAILVGGGVPVVDEGSVVGGLGVSGGTEVQDDEIASSAAAGQPPDR